MIKLLERTGQVSLPVPSGCLQSLHGELLRFSISFMLLCIIIFAFVFMFICTVHVKETKDGHKWSGFVVGSLRACALVFITVQCSSEVKGEGSSSGGTHKIQRNVHFQTYPIVADVSSRVRDGTCNLLSIYASATGGH